MWLFIVLLTDVLTCSSLQFTVLKGVWCWSSSPPGPYIDEVLRLWAPDSHSQHQVLSAGINKACIIRRPEWRSHREQHNHWETSSGQTSHTTRHNTRSTLLPWSFGSWGEPTADGKQQFGFLAATSSSFLWRFNPTTGNYQHRTTPAKVRNSCTRSPSGGGNGQRPTVGQISGVEIKSQLEANCFNLY